MTKYSPGDIVYIVANNRWVKKLEVQSVAYGLVTLRFLDHPEYIRLRESRLYPTQEAAEAALPKKEPPAGSRNR